jgi:hypothetical protein
MSSRPDHGGYNKRFIAFDLFGTVLTERDQWFRTSKDAENVGAAWMAGFDSAAHTVATLKAKADHDIREARRILAALRAKPATVAL